MMRTNRASTASSIPSIPDLLSFDSREYDSRTLVTASQSQSLCTAESTESLDGDRSTTLQVATNIPLSHYDLSTAASPGSSTTKTATLPPLTPPNRISITTPPLKKCENDVQVSVSGVTFNLQPEVFSQLANLPWQLQDFELSATDSIYSLHTSPELFEVILNHVLFGTLPDVRSLDTVDVEELEPMALLLGLNALEKHLLEGRRSAYMFLAPRSRRKCQSASKIGMTGDCHRLLSASRRKSDGAGPRQSIHRHSDCYRTPPPKKGAAERSPPGTYPGRKPRMHPGAASKAVESPKDAPGTAHRLTSPLRYFSPQALLRSARARWTNGSITTKSKHDSIISAAEMVI